MQNTLEQAPQACFIIKGSDLLEFGNKLIADTIAEYKETLAAQIKAQNEERLLTVEEAAAFFGVCKRTLARWKESGYFIPVQVGGVPKYKFSECRALLDRKAR